MPVVDTEVLFALNPNDPKHAKALKLLKSAKNLRCTDVAVLEFQLVLRGRGRQSTEVRDGILALSKALSEHGVEERKTLDTIMLALQGEIETKHELSYFDSLIAASALSVDAQIISDDAAFDRVPGLKRIGVSSAGPRT